MKQLTKELLFPAPVYQTYLEDYALLNIYLKSRLYSWRQRLRSGLGGGAGSTKGTWQSAGNMHELQEFRLFFAQIQSVMKAVLHNQGCDKANGHWCAEMTANISDRFGFEQPLSVQRPGWRGIYFVQATDDCGGTVFHNPGSGQDSRFVERKVCIREYEAIAGRVLLFPSWLPYEMEPNRSHSPGVESDRISIGFSFSEPGDLTTEP